MIMTHRIKWYARHYALAPVVIFLGASTWIMAHDVAGALTFLTILIWMVIAERGDRWSYRMGFGRAVHVIMEANRRAQSADEYHRLIVGVPEPWDDGVWVASRKDH